MGLAGTVQVRDGLQQLGLRLFQQAVDVLGTVLGQGCPLLLPVTLSSLQGKGGVRSKKASSVRSLQYVLCCLWHSGKSHSLPTAFQSILGNLFCLGEALGSNPGTKKKTKKQTKKPKKKLFSPASFISCNMLPRLPWGIYSPHKGPAPMAPAPLAGDGGGNVGPLPPNQHLHRHSLVHASLARSIKAFGRVAPLGENWGSLSWPTQLMEVHWGAGRRHLEVQTLVEVSLGRHLLGGLTQEVVGGRPHTLVHLPGVEDSEENCEATGSPTEGESRGAWGKRDWLGLRTSQVDSNSTGAQGRAEGSIQGSTSVTLWGISTRRQAHLHDLSQLCDSLGTRGHSQAIGEGRTFGSEPACP